MTVSDVLFAMIQTGLILFKLGGIGVVKTWGWTMVLAPTWIYLFLIVFTTILCELFIKIRNR